MIVVIQLALRNLLRNRRRTAAVLVTVALGSGSLFLFHGFNAGIMHQYKENTIHARHGHGQITQKGYRDTVYERPWEHWIGGWRGISADLHATPGVIRVFPRIEFFALLTNGRVTISGRGQGIDGAEEAEFFNTLNVEAGVTLSRQSDGMLLGRGLARALDVKPGDRVTVLSNTVHGSMNGGDFTVVGVFHSGAKEFDDTVFRIPLKQAGVLLDTDKVESISVGLARDDAWPSLVQTVHSRWPELESIPFSILDKVYYQNSVDWLDSQFGVIRLIILTIVVLGIFNTVSTSVMERKQEIGNLRANGESQADILRLLAWEGAALGALGALLGLGLAFALDMTLLRNGILMPPAPGLTRQFHVMVEFQPVMALAAFVLGLLTALLGTLMAGLRVARMPIAEALRSL